MNIFVFLQKYWRTEGKDFDRTRWEFSISRLEPSSTCVLFVFLDEDKDWRADGIYWDRTK